MCSTFCQTFVLNYVIKRVEQAFQERIEIYFLIETVATTEAPVTTAAPGPVITAAPGTCQVFNCSKNFSFPFKGILD